MGEYAVDLGGALLELPDQHGLSPYSWRGVCRIPGCGRPATDPHHAIPRGRLGLPARYVLLDGQLVPNVIGLDAFHHNRLTIGESLLLWREGRWWYQSPERATPAALLPIGNEGCIRATGARYCPVCGRPPVPRDPYRHNGQRRERAAYEIRVPADAENGADVLETLTEQVGTMLGLHNPESQSAAYYALAAALTVTIQNPSLIRDLAAAP
jgi:hypothetical protein